MGRHYLIWAVFLGMTVSVSATTTVNVGSLDPVLVTANPWYTPASRLGFKTQRITEAVIQETGATTIGDVVGTLTNANAVNSGHKNSIFIRGLPPRFSKVLLNGMDLRDPIDPNSSPLWDGINLSTIGEIHYVEGSQGALLGDSAVVGALNLVVAPVGTDISAKGGDRYYQTAFKTGNTAGNWQWAVAVSREADNRYSAEKASGGEIDDYYSNNYFGSLVWETPQFRFSTQGLIVDSVTLLDSGTSPSNRLNSALGRYGANLEWTINPNEKIGVRYHLGSVTRGDYSSLLATFNATSHTVDTYAECTVEKSKTIVGLTLQNESGSDAGFYGSTPLRIQNSAAIYAAGIQNFNLFSVNQSLRLTSDYMSRLGLVGGIGVATSLNSVIGLNANVSSGVRPPSIYENARTDTQLSPENGTSIDLGLSTNWGWMSNRISGFYSVITNRIKDFYPEPDYNTTYRNLPDQTIIKGIEIGSTLAGIGTLTYTATNAWTDSLGEDARVPRFKWTASTQQTFGPYAMTILFQSIGQSRDSLYSSTLLGEYALTDVTLRYIGDAHWMPFVSVSNVFDTQYEQASGYTTPGRTLILGASYRID
ncbi:TonB-dependent receptor [bacterium]|nr:TonB-dependent receptor [bacterium]